MKSKTTRLKEHHERLIFLNSVNHYTQSGNPKIDKYYKLLKEIQKRIFIINNYTPINPNSFFNPTLNAIQQLKNK
jgi:hypothetical protein